MSAKEMLELADDIEFVIANGVILRTADYLREVQKALRRHAAESAEPAAWQPIETAPKDGTAILVGFWYQDRFAKYLAFYGEHGWMENSRRLHPKHFQEWFTVWHPLPSAPGAAPQPAVTDMPTALREACLRLQKFLDTFGDLGDCVTQADINDWFELTSPGAAPQPAVPADGNAKEGGQPAVPADEDEIDYDDPHFNQGVNHVVDLLAKTIGATDWVAGDGSEDYDEDLAQTLLNILAARGLYDRDEGTFGVQAAVREALESAREYLQVGVEDCSPGWRGAQRVVDQINAALASASAGQQKEG